MMKKCVVFCSGSGTTFDYLANSVVTKKAKFVIVGMVASRANIKAIDFAKKYQIQSFVQSKENEKEMLAFLREKEADFIVLAGFLKKVTPQLLSHYPNKVVNTHPSLLPKFGGLGMYGRYVHQAVADSTDSKTGVTVHIVTENYDEGPILGQKKIAINLSDTAEIIEEKVKKIEKPFLLEMLNTFVGTI